MLKVEIPDNNDKIEKMIKALKFQLRQDTREEDKKIHQQALNDLEKALELRNENCEFCDNPYSWSKNDVIGDKIHIKCGECGREFTREFYGQCKNEDCGFYLDKDGHCELCEE